jgi:hypothetical protein
MTDHEMIEMLEGNPAEQDELLDAAVNGPDEGPAWLRLLADWRES